VSKLNVYQRIHAVMNEINTIAKNGRNEFQRYDYATEADYVHAIRPLLQKHGLVITPKMQMPVMSQPDEKGTVVSTALVEFTITNIDNPAEQVTTSVLGQGSDKGDKGVYKLMTGAKKYFMSLTFMIATGDDPENDGARKSSVVAKQVATVTPAVATTNGATAAPAAPAKRSSFRKPTTTVVPKNDI
jgi:hypothetical protein